MKMSTGELDRSFKPKIARSIINSCGKWNYQLVQDILDKKITKVEEVDEAIRPSAELFELMKQDCFNMNEIA